MTHVCIQFLFICLQRNEETPMSARTKQKRVSPLTRDVPGLARDEG